MRYLVKCGDQEFTIEVNQDGQIELDGQVVYVDFVGTGETGLFSLLVNGESFEAMVEDREGLWNVLMRGHLYEIEVIDERTQLLRARAGAVVPESGEISVKAPMPGLVVAIPVEVGQGVEAGQNVIILESMKMENELKAPRAGRIERINVKPRQSVEQNQILVVIV